MTTDALTALLRIRQVAALVMHRAGYLPDQIPDHLGATTTAAETDAVTPQLLTAAGQYLSDVGFTYWGIPEAIAKLRRELASQPTPEPEPDAWGHGLLFDLAGAAP